MQNEDADLIFSFWRWEYLRRSPFYVAAYEMMAYGLNILGIEGFHFEKIGEDQRGDEMVINFDLSATLNAIPAHDEMAKVEKTVLFLSTLEKFCNSFKLFPPLNPAEGLSAKKILEKFIQADIVKQRGGEDYIHYRSFVRLNHISHISSVVRDIESPLPKSPLLIPALF